jgi:transcriptional regulator with XRE-family HTH domain
MPTLGEQLKALRVKAGKTQEQLATELHTTKAAISRYEKDQRQPRLEVLTEMAMLLDASPDDLYCLYLATTEFEDEQGIYATRMNALSKWVETICGANNMITDAAEKHGLSNEFVEGVLTTREKLDSEDSSFALHRADEDAVAQKLMEIFKKLDRDWQVALVDDAEVYLKIQEEKKAKIQKLKQDVE